MSDSEKSDPADAKHEPEERAEENARLLAENAALRAEVRQLREESELRAQANEVGDVGTWRWNIETGTVDWDETQRAVWGVGPKEVVHLDDALARVHPDDLEPMHKAIQSALEGNNGAGCEFRVRMNDGGQRWFRTRAASFRDPVTQAPLLVGVNYDVTEVYEAIEARDEAQRKQELALEAAQMGVWSQDLDANEVRLDARMRKYFGLEPGGPITVPTSDLVAVLHPDDLHLIAEAHRSAIEREGAVGYDVEFRVVLEGGVRWLRSVARCSFAPAPDGGEARPRYVFGVTRDVTPEVERRDELQRKTEAARAASRAKSQFLANTSHEIRTPMTAILGFSEVLAQRLERPEDLDVIALIQRNGEHLLTILGDILDLARVESGQYTIRPQNVDLHALLTEVRSLLLHRAADKGLELRIEHTESAPRWARTDPVRLRQILLNLTGNALKFTAQGQVTLVLDGDEDDVRLSVIDTGPGIASDQLERMFEPFSQLEEGDRREHGGTGLGLAIVRRLSEALGGGACSESQPGLGSRFTVWFPRTPARTVERGAPTGDTEAAPPKEPSSEGRAPSGGTVTNSMEGLHVLVVDDNDDILQLLELLLRQRGAQVTTAGDGAEAVERVHRAPEAFDAVLLDMQMPVLDGYAAASQLRAEGHSLPILALTARSLDDELEACLTAGCDAYLTKPVDIDVLTEYIADHVRA